MNQDKEDKSTRKRSSKACDNCRKSKCKCERVEGDERCQNCVLINSECNFVVPTKKRGPPKGYIDVVEGRLHQLESLISAIISSNDLQARSLIKNLSQDSLARDILAGLGSTAGRPVNLGESRPSLQQGSSARKLAVEKEKDIFSTPDDPSIHTSAAWQDRLCRLLSSPNGHSSLHSEDINSPNGLQRAETTHSLGQPTVESHGSTSQAHIQREQHQQSFLQTQPLAPPQQFIGGTNERGPRLPPTHHPGPAQPHLPDIGLETPGNSDRPQLIYPSMNRSAASRSDEGSAPLITETPRWPWSKNPATERKITLPTNFSPEQSLHPPVQADSKEFLRRRHVEKTLFSSLTGHSISKLRTSTSFDMQVDPLGDKVLRPPSPPLAASEPEDGLTGYFADIDCLTDSVGQLSINEHNHVRYHSKASGLHLLALAGETVDARQNGGSIWALSASEIAKGGRAELGTWPSEPSIGIPAAKITSPSGRMTEYFLSGLRVAMPSRKTQNSLLLLYFTHVHPVMPILHPGDFMRSYRYMFGPHDGLSPIKPEPIPKILLLAIFSVASCLAEKDPTPAEPPGEAFYKEGRRILYDENIPSQLSTCQALLIFAYREKGLSHIGPACQFHGMAIKTAQDMGLHRSMEKWQPVGALKFTREEDSIRRRIWHCCLHLDKYLAMTIGRPLSVYEVDHDTPFPEETEAENLDHWEALAGLTGQTKEHIPAPQHVISCFHQSAKLDAVIGEILTQNYAVRPSITNRHDKLTGLIQRMDTWFFSLPKHLRYSPDSSAPLPPPHVITLHILYWTASILLCRPYLRLRSGGEYPPRTDPRIKLSEAESCNRIAFYSAQEAANRITQATVAIAKAYPVQQWSMYLAFYSWTASIMHFHTLLSQPHDVQAALSLQQSLDFLKTLGGLWPSAGVAWSLMDGTKVNTLQAEIRELRNAPSRRSKRRAEDSPEREPYSSLPQEWDILDSGEVGEDSYLRHLAPLELEYPPMSRVSHAAALTHFPPAGPSSPSFGSEPAGALPYGIWEASSEHRGGLQLPTGQYMYPYSGVPPQFPPPPRLTNDHWQLPEGHPDQEYAHGGHVHERLAHHHHSEHRFGPHHHHHHHPSQEFPIPEGVDGNGRPYSHPGVSFTPANAPHYHDKDDSLNWDHRNPL